MGLKWLYSTTGLPKAHNVNTLRPTFSPYHSPNATTTPKYSKQKTPVQTHSLETFCREVFVKVTANCLALETSKVSCLSLRDF
ncbi:hypothetical protein J6590_047300 [Homalodisca vitripennis]|nr:hypothetical protein J6590_047300 [Homalodisca vitripennis]